MKFIVLLLFTLLCSFGYSAEHQMRCSSDLKPILEKIEMLPEGRELISKVLEQGPLQIKLNRKISKKFEGYWSSWDRTIYITKYPASSECSLITTLLFELHNALRTDELEKVYSLASKHQINRKEFIQRVEYIEYENAYYTCQLLCEGVKLRIFPYNCYWNIPDSFSEHFQIQKAAGHSAWIGKMYDELRRF